MKAKYLLTAGLGIAAVTTQVRASELLTNGTFTGGTSPWTLTGDTVNAAWNDTSAPGILHSTLDDGATDSQGYLWYTHNGTGFTATQSVTVGTAGNLVLSGQFQQRDDLNVPGSHSNATFTLSLLDANDLELTPNSTSGSFPGDSLTNGTTPDPAQTVTRSYTNLPAGTYTVKYTIAGGQGASDNLSLDFTSSNINFGRWNGIASSDLDATSLNFCTNADNAPLSQGNLAAVFPIASFGDSYFDNSSSVAVTANNLTVAAGGVSTGTFLFDNSTALAYTLNSADAMGITGSSALVKTGNGILTLNGANSYSGTTTVRQGSLVVRHNDALGSGTVILGDTAGNASLLLDLPASSDFSRPISVPGSGSGTVTFGWIPAASNTGANHPVISSAINLDGRNLILQPGAVNDHGDRLDLTGVISGTGNITVDGVAARLIFSGGSANTWVGNLAVDAGSTLQLSDGAATSTNFIPDSAAVTVDGILSNATSGNNETIGALAGSGTLTGFSHGGSSFWTLGSGDGSASFSGVIENGTGTMNLTKTGTGTQTLSGPNTYSGNTVVNDGTLQVTSSGSLRFRPTSNGLTNAVSGSATATLSFTGTVSLDLTAAVATDGNTWNLFSLGSFSGPAPTLTPAAVTTTTLGSFNEITPGVWELPVIGAKWVFTENNGDLAYITTATDYDTWKSDNGVIGGENDDDDNDGRTNREEYAFGLDPTGGASVNPITVQLNKTAKTISYTRRDTSKTDLTYSVWFSTDLSAWTEDTSAAEGTPVLSGEVETVQVTLSNLPGDPLPAKLFIQVRAN